MFEGQVAFRCDVRHQPLQICVQNRHQGKRQRSQIVQHAGPNTDQAHPMWKNFGREYPRQCSAVSKVIR